MTQAPSQSTSTGQAARATAAQNVGIEDAQRRTAEIAGGDALDEAGNVDVGGAGSGAGRVETVEAAIGLDRGSLRRERRLELAEALAQAADRRAGSLCSSSSSGTARSHRILQTELHAEATRGPYRSGRRSRKNCQVRRTSAISSRSRSAVSTSSWSRAAWAMIWPRGLAEVARAIKLADVPGRLGADAVDGGDEIAVGGGVRGLLQLPEIFAQAGDGGRGVEDDLGAVQAEAARAFGKMAVVADVDADLGEAEVEDGVAEVAGAEIKLLPEAGRHVGDVRLAVFAEVGAVVRE